MQQLLHTSLIQPTYERTNLQEKIIHFGLGNFHRGHQAFILNAVNNKMTTDWGICAINLFDDSQQLVEKMGRQENLYTVLERSIDYNQATLVGSIIHSMKLQDVGLTAIIDKLCEPQVEIVTFTITEKGYCTLPGGCALDLNNSLIKHDLHNLSQAKSMPAILYLALKKRYELGMKALTLLSCDNMPENGQALFHAVSGFIEAIDPEFKKNLHLLAAFPSSMVDRIVPAVTNETLNTLEAITGSRDECGLITEPFIQWVIEDNFAGDRPQWESIGGIFIVKDVRPFEEMKLRMLNGSHSFLAYLGNLSGYDYISDCMKDSNFFSATYYLMLSEQAPTLIVDNQDIPKYAEQLLERFQNNSLKHATAQIAMDGSQKIPQRFLASIEWHLKKNLECPLLTLGLAGWMSYMANHSDELKDPMQKELHALIENCDKNEEVVESLLSGSNIFSDYLKQHDAWKKKLIQDYLSIAQYGVRTTVAIVLKNIKKLEK